MVDDADRGLTPRLLVCCPPREGGPVEFVIAAASGESVTVHGDNWMMAMGKAMAFFKMDATAMVRWVCTPGPRGQVRVEDPVASRAYTITPVEQAIKIVVAAASAELAFEDEPTREETVEVAVNEPPPLLSMPLKSRLAAPAHAVDAIVFSSENLAERLFDLSMDLAGAPAELACQRALDLILEFVPCEASSVVRGTHADFCLTFAAASGPVADRIKGRSLEFGQGLIGLCYDAGISIQVNDVQHDDRHEARFDHELGFSTRCVLSVPVQHEGQMYGVVQLINPTTGTFTAEHVEVAQNIARTLAASLADPLG